MRKTTASPLSPVPGSDHSDPADGVNAAMSPWPASYEAALAELEKLVMQLEGGQLPLEQLLTGYQRGAQLLKFCRAKLEAVENQIKVLDGAELKPWVPD